MLGTFLRLERTRMGYTTRDVANRLNLNDTYYRLVESGRAAINQSLVFKLIEVFAGSDVPSYNSRTIILNRFSLYLVSAHWVGAEMGILEDAPSSAKLAMEALAQLESDFQHFHSQTKWYYDLSEGDEQRRFLEDIAAPEVGDFLRMEFYGRPQNATKDLMCLDEIPTLNIDVILDLKKSLNNRLFIHTHELASTWETERASQFKNSRLFCKHPELIVNPKNLQMFHYDYLGSERFLSCRHIFFEGVRTVDDIKMEFVELANSGRKQRNLSELKTKEIEKLSFAVVNEQRQHLHAEAIENVFTHDFNSYDAFWSFETHIGLEIAFVGVQNGNLEVITNLNLREAYRKVSEFDKLWEAINDKA
jgi:transcriptional regulator with XRE-family HTH domain